MAEHPGAAGGRRGDAFGRVLDAVDAVSMAGAWAAVACVLGILALIASEVLARNLFNVSLSFAWEFSTYLTGASFLLGAGYALRAGAQIRVRVLLENVPRPVARGIDLLATVCGFAIAVYLTWALAQQTIFAIERNSRSPDSEFALWIPRLVLTVGAAIFTLQLAGRLGRLLRGEPGEEARLRLGQDIE
jgi:TRAP-type C4-dicarboxylate transport system permease small subunit